MCHIKQHCILWRLKDCEDFSYLKCLIKLECNTCRTIKPRTEINWEQLIKYQNAKIYMSNLKTMWDLTTSKNLFNSVPDWHNLSCLLAFTLIWLHIETEASNLFPQWNVQCYFYKMILPTQHYLQETDLARNTKFRIQSDIFINCPKLQI